VDTGVSLECISALQKDQLIDRFDQFDLTRSGQLSSYDLQRLLAKDSLMEDPREDAVKMVRRDFWFIG
jgi:hypothetical protein